MKIDSGLTDFLMLPAEEAGKTIEAMKRADEINDIEALKWCARRIAWLDDVSEIIDGEDYYYRAHLFNKAWKKELESDAVPDSIKGIIARIDQEIEPKPANTAEERRASK